jgi:Lytic transglycolase/Bacterial SH3 domain
MSIVRSLRQIALLVLLSLGASIGLVGAVTQDVAATAIPEAAGTASPVGSVRWTTTAVNVRGHPTTATKSLFVLAGGTPVRIVRVATDAARRTWYLVRVQSRLGWLAGWLTRTAAAKPAPTSTAATTPGAVRWTTASVNVRGHPTTASKPLFVLAAGTAVRVVRSATDTARRTWYLVRVRSRLGWLAAWLVRGAVVAPAATTHAAWQTAQASSFGVGDGLVGSHMACGKTLTESVMAVANRTLPCGTRLRLRVGGHVVEAQVLDRGPYVDGRTFDLAPAVCRALGACSGVTTIDWQLAN